MKIIISESQYKSITQEVKTKEKEKVGEGIHHIVYPSKKYPDKVYKIGPPGLIKSWINDFKENPNIFPKIYHVGNGQHEQFKYMFVLLEKLNTNKLKNLWTLLDDITSHVYSNVDFDDIINRYTFRHEIDPEFITPLKKFIQENYPNIYDEFMELMTLTDNVIKIKRYPDLHIGQFGYDQNNKLKCLDI